MRIVLTGDRFWVCPQLDHGVLQRLIDRSGSEFVITHGDATGIDRLFGTAEKGLGLAVKARPADRNHFGKSAGPDATWR